MWRGGGARTLSSVQRLGGDSVGSGGWQALRSTTAERTTVRNKEHEEHCEEHEERTGEAIIQAERLSAVQTIQAEHEFEFCLTTSNTLERCTVESTANSTSPPKRCTLESVSSPSRYSPFTTLSVTAPLSGCTAVSCSTLPAAAHHARRHHPS